MRCSTEARASAQDGQVEIQCGFCGQRYHFPLAEMGVLFLVDIRSVISVMARLGRVLLFVTNQAAAPIVFEQHFIDGVGRP